MYTYIFNQIVDDFSSTVQDCMKLYIPCIHKHKLLTVFYVEGFSFRINVKSFIIYPLVIVIKLWERYYFDLKRKQFNIC